jgi:acyl-ACP thioesterase
MRIRVDIERNPAWNEEITIETWPQPPKKYEFERDYIVRDADGNIIIRAISIWIIFDIKTRELRKSELIAIDYPPFPAERAIDCRLRKLKPFGELNIAYKKAIGYSDVDFNGHINNSRYIDFIMDCFSVENHKHYGVRSIEVDYINEAMPGETLVIRRDISALSSNRIYIEGVNEMGDKVVFKAEVEICAR